MQLLTRQVTVGEDLAIEVERSSYRQGFNSLAAALRLYEDAGHSTYARLFELEAVPEGTTSPNRKVRRRLYLVCLALHIPFERYGLTEADRHPMWPEDEFLLKQIERDYRALNSCYVPFDPSWLDEVRTGYGNLRAS